MHHYIRYIQTIPCSSAVRSFLLLCPIFLHLPSPEKHSQTRNRERREKAPGQKNAEIQADIVFGVENDGTDGIADSIERSCDSIAIQTRLKFMWEGDNADLRM